MKTTTRKQTVYEADDGTPFLKKEQCEAYEKDLKNTRAFRIHHGPDTTEKGTLQRTLLLFVKAKWSHELWAELWCEGRFGSRVDFVQGVAICPAWRIGTVLPLHEAIEQEKEGTAAVHISEGDTTRPTWKDGRPVEAP